jgi:hypothetical protein
MMKEGLFTFKEKRKDFAPDAGPRQRRKANLFFAMTAARFSEITMKIILKIYTVYGRRVMTNERKTTNAPAAEKNSARSIKKQFV